ENETSKKKETLDALLKKRLPNHIYQIIRISAFKLYGFQYTPEMLNKEKKLPLKHTRANKKDTEQKNRVFFDDDWDKISDDDDRVEPKPKGMFFVRLNLEDSSYQLKNLPNVLRLNGHIHAFGLDPKDCLTSLLVKRIENPFELLETSSKKQLKI